MKAPSSEVAYGAWVGCGGSIDGALQGIVNCRRPSGTTRISAEPLQWKLLPSLNTHTTTDPYEPTDELSELKKRSSPRMLG